MTTATVLRRGLTAALPLLASAGLLLSGCAEPRRGSARQRVPRVVLVTFDTLHVDFTSLHNPEIDFTPNLDRFASKGTLFERAYARVPITLPSHVGLMTGRDPVELGVMLNGDELGPEVETLAETLSAAGYRTGAFVSLGVLRERFGLAQGFEHYDDDLHALRYRWYRTADEIVELAASWLREVGDEPFFAWLHLSDPHEPYLSVDAPPDVRLDLDGRPVGEWNLTSKERHAVTLELPPGGHRLTWTSLRPARDDDRAATSLRLRLAGTESLEPWVGPEEGDLGRERDLRRPFTLELRNGTAGPAEIELRFEGRIHDPPPSEVWEQYPLEVAFTDRQLGRLRELVDGAGSAREKDVPTLWILVSDHGEGLYRRGILGHADAAHEDQLRLLLLLEGPGVPAGRRLATPVLIEDVMPTMLDLLGLETPGGASGVSRRDCWAGSGCEPREEWWSYGADAATGAVTAVAGYRGDWKLLAQGKRSGCFYLPDDAWEERNLGRAFTRRPERMPPEVRALDRGMQQRWAELQRRLDERGAEPLDDEQRELLESLGYLN